MASAKDNNAMPTIPGLPPLVGIEGQRYRDEVLQLFFGQNWMLQGLNVPKTSEAKVACNQ